MTDPRTVAFRPEQLTAEGLYLLLRDSVVPRPIAWVSTVDTLGRHNLAPYSFFNVCSCAPPVIGFSVGGLGLDPESRQWRVKDTLSNVKATGELVVNIVPESLMQPMVASAGVFPPGHSEFELCGLQPLPSAQVKPPRVAGAPVAMECTLLSVIDLGHDAWVMARVVEIHVDERVHLGTYKGVEHRIDLLREPTLRPVGRLGRANYVHLDHVTAVLRPDWTND